MKNMFVIMLFVVLFVLVLACGFTSGPLPVQASSKQPEVEKRVEIQVPVYVDRPYYQFVEKLVYIDRLIYKITGKPSIVEVIKWRNIYHREFQSVEQFTEWYRSQGFTVLFPSGSYNVDCDDYAELVQIKALEQGYTISQALILNGNYYGTRVNDTVGGHAGNIVLIDNACYYFEPNPEKFNIKKIIDRD
jgi:hypothetical protein